MCTLRKTQVIKSTVGVNTLLFSALSGGLWSKNSDSLFLHLCLPNGAIILEEKRWVESLVHLSLIYLSQWCWSTTKKKKNRQFFFFSKIAKPQSYSGLGEKIIKLNIKLNLIGLFIAKSDQKVIGWDQCVTKRPLSMAECSAWKKFKVYYGTASQDWGCSLSNAFTCLSIYLSIYVPLIYLPMYLITCASACVCVFW